MTQYISHAKSEIADILLIINANWDKHNRVKLGNGFEVGVTSLRLKTFAKGADSNGVIKCKCCGLEAKFFSVDSFARSKTVSYHINLYGELNGKDILFTHDHILARSLGGKDDISNTQVMCSPCNSAKGKIERAELLARRDAGEHLPCAKKKKKKKKVVPC